MKVFFLYCLFSALFTISGFAQTVRGRVVSGASGEGLEGASISIKRSSQVTAAGPNGWFVFKNLSLHDTLLASCIGYQGAEIVFEGQQPLLIHLSPQESILQEVTVNTGYQTLPRERATGSFTKVDGALLQQQVTTNILDRLPAVANGLTLDRRTNTPGLMIRGLSTIQGPKGPLVVVDNFSYDGDISNINPNDVESITLLKDAAAASIWGTKAGNGVIVITTKKSGFRQPFSIEANQNITVTQAPNLFYTQPITSSDYIDVEQFLFSKGYKFSDTANLNRPPFTPVYELLFRQRRGLVTQAAVDAALNALRGVDIRKDLSDRMYQNSVNQQYALTLRGGSEQVNWLFSGGYDKNRSELGRAYQRINIRSQNTYQPFKKLQLLTSLYWTQSFSHSGRPGYSDFSTANGALPPYTQLADASGNPLPVIKNYRQGYVDTAGGGRLLDWNYYPLLDYKQVQGTTTLQDMTGQVGLLYQILPGLQGSVRYQYERQEATTQTIQGAGSYAARDLVNRFSQLNRSTDQVTYKVPVGGILDKGGDLLLSQQVRGQLDYRGDWHRHSLILLGGSEIREARSTNSSARYYGYDDDILTTANVDFANTYPSFINGAASFIPNNSGLGGQLNRFVSFYANGAYTYQQRYTFSVSGRRDASNLFGVATNQKWNPLWSTGFAWILSKEPCYGWSFLPLLKLRITYGYSGNADPSRSAVTIFNYLGSSPYTLTPYAQIQKYANPDLRWEKVGMLNLGLDFGSKGGLLSGSLEYYRKKGVDLFGNALIDYTGGAGSTMLKNVARMRGEGLDLAVSSRINLGVLRWMVQWNLSLYHDRITKYYLASLQGSGFVGTTHPAISGMEGKPVYGIFSYRWAGLDPLTGDPQGYLNGQVSKDFTAITGTGTQVSDLVYEGPALPTVYGSMGHTLSWRGLSLTARIIYKLGYYLRRESLNYTALFSARTGQAEFARRWQKPGDEAWTSVPSMIYPANTRRDQFYNGSEVTVVPGDHVRLQYLQLQYRPGEKKEDKRTLRGLQVYANLNDPGLLWRANALGLDPDYPTSEVPPSPGVSLGFRISL